MDRHRRTAAVPASGLAGLLPASTAAGNTSLTCKAGSDGRDRWTAS